MAQPFPHLSLGFTGDRLIHLEKLTEVLRQTQVFILEHRIRKGGRTYFSKMIRKDESFLTEAISPALPTEPSLPYPPCWVCYSGPRFQPWLRTKATWEIHFQILMSRPHRFWFNWPRMGSHGFNMQPESRTTGCNQRQCHCVLSLTLNNRRQLESQ